MVARLDFFGQIALEFGAEPNYASRRNADGLCDVTRFYERIKGAPLDAEHVKGAR